MALPGNVLKTSKVGDSSIHLINLYPSLLMEKFFLISCLNVPSHNWWLMSMKLVTKLWRVSLHSSCNSSSGSCGLQLDLSLPHNLLFVTQNKSQIKSKSVALGFSFCGGLLQGLLLLLSHLLELWRGKPDMTFQLLLYQHWVKKYNNFFLICWPYALCSQYKICFICDQSLLLAHFQLGTNHHQVLFSKAKMSIKIYAFLERKWEKCNLSKQQ